MKQKTRRPKDAEFPDRDSKKVAIYCGAKTIHNYYEHKDEVRTLDLVLRGGDGVWLNAKRARALARWLERAASWCEEG